MREKREKLSVSLPPDLARKLREMAAERHVPVSGLVALAVERYAADQEAAWYARRAELFARAALLGVAELLDRDTARDAVYRLVGEAQAQMRKLGVKRRDDKGAGLQEGVDGEAGA